MPLLYQPGDRLIDGIGIVHQHRISSHTLNDPVHLNGWDTEIGCQLIEFISRQIFRYVDQAVYAVGNKEAEVVPLQTVIGAVTGDQRVIPMLPQAFVQRRNDRAVERRRHVRQQNADGTAPLCLQAPGKGIDPIVKPGNGIADRLHIFTAHMTAVEILGDSGHRNTRHLRYILDGCHGISLLLARIVSR